MRVALPVAVLLAVMFATAPSAYAHTTVTVDPYQIDVGWGTEPPIVGIRNTVVFHVVEMTDNPGVVTGVKNAFKDMTATIKSGSESKQLSINSDPRIGHYFSNIIPTKTGSYDIFLEGAILDTPVSINVPVEDIEGTAILDFPPRPAGGEDIGPLKRAITALQQEVSEMGGSVGSGARGEESASYNYAVFGLSLGAAAFVLSVIAMLRRKSN